MNPLMTIPYAIKLNLKKDNFKENLKPTIKIALEYFLEMITNFGISAISYKEQENVVN